MSAPRILVADDEVGHRDLARYLLEPLGYDVVTACDGAEALALFEREPFALVILDVHMPMMQGPEALARMLALRPAQKIVVVSGSSEADIDPSSIQGAAACLFKPLTIDELTAVVGANAPLARDSEVTT